MNTSPRTAPDARWLGCPLPLIQAPMAGVQDERLALAVSRSGALGSLPAAMLSPEALDQALTRLDASALPYNVNFFCHTPPPEPHAPALARWQATLAPYYRELGLAPTDTSASRRPFDTRMAEVLAAHRPAVVSFHFGLPDAALLARVKALGARVLSSATTLEEALWLQANGADAVIAQGLEAGGHRGHFLQKDPARQSSTFTLLAQLVAALEVPVIAAGGIAQADDVRRAMQLGAAAVQVGTAFLLCDEATTHPLHRARLADVEAPPPLTRLFSGGLARGLENRLMRELGPLNEAAPPFPLASGALAPLRTQAERLGRDDFTPLWSGTNRRGCRAVPAAQIVQALAAGLDPAVGSGAHA